MFSDNHTNLVAITFGPAFSTCFILPLFVYFNCVNLFPMSRQTVYQHLFSTTGCHYDHLAHRSNVLIRFFLFAILIRWHFPTRSLQLTLHWFVVPDPALLFDATHLGTLIKSWWRQPVAFWEVEDLWLICMPRLQQWVWSLNGNLSHCNSFYAFPNRTLIYNLTISSLSLSLSLMHSNTWMVHSSTWEKNVNQSM